MAKPLQESASESYVVSMSVFFRALDEVTTFLAVVNARSQEDASRAGRRLELQWLGQVLEMGSGTLGTRSPYPEVLRDSLKYDGFFAGALTVFPYSDLASGTVRLFLSPSPGLRLGHRRVRGPANQPP